MTSLFQARRRAEDFAAAVDRQAGDRHEAGPEVAELVGLVTALRAQPAVAPREQFSADLRSRLMLEAETALRPENATLLLPTRQPGRRERHLVAAASALVLVGGTATMAAAAQSALPGDALYPIKRGIERADLGLTVSEAGKGKDLLSQASHRLVEVEGLVAAASAESQPRVPETLTDFATSAQEGSELLFKVYTETGDPESVVEVRTFAAEGITTLESLAAEVPADAQDELADAALLLHALDREATALCGSCAQDLPVVELPDIFLARAEVDRALSLASAHELRNDHPVVVVKGAVPARATAPAAPAPKTAEPGDQTGTTPTDEAPASPLPSPTWEQPESWPSLLPGLDGGTTTNNKDSGSSLTGKATEELQSGLTGVVETLLPDADGNLLD